MSVMKPDTTPSVSQETMLQSIRHAIDMHELLVASVKKEHEFLMSADFDQVGRVRRQRKLITRDLTAIRGTLNMASDLVMAGKAGPELTLLMDRLRGSVLDAADAVNASISYCELERNSMLQKINTLRSSKRALDSYARYGGAN